ncbi:immunoglobulin-like domain-containing protein [Pseudomonas sp. 147P]|uniref:immunoglobulin-like domain-containing protein n=1 Tax=Pseudomonas ulcerans TaxID=3115852 RepID=UPI002E7B923D|nr:immunoglobulin-like domain-containing protein [Pseudomonas sp. 147P]MEE1926574.1 immunoglobulin-like domain-containing protein [Pseudomonas sp. 147P]
MKISLSNGETITIGKGLSEGSITFPAPQNTVYVDGGNVSVTITGTTGGDFEHLEVSPTAAVTAVTDSIEQAPPLGLTRSHFVASELARKKSKSTNKSKSSNWQRRLCCRRCVNADTARNSRRQEAERRCLEGAGAQHPSA